jgi:hypothetical protein
MYVYSIYMYECSARAPARLAAGAARREGVHGGGAARARHRPAPVFSGPVRAVGTHACLVACGYT